MVDIKVGMYVRTEKGIAKYLGLGIDVLKDDGSSSYNHWKSKHLFDNYIFEEEYGDTLTTLENIDKIIVGKPSYNIIDLIEEGDLCIIEFYSPRYEERIKRLFEVEYKKDYTISFQNAHCSMNIFGGVWSNEDKELKPAIKSIVTHEQFENMKYEVE